MILNKFYILLFYLFNFLAVLDLNCCTGFSLVVVSWDYSLGALRRLLIAVVPLVAEFKLLESTWASVVAASGLWSTGLKVVAHGLSCSAACAIFLDQGWKLCLLLWQVTSLALSRHQRSSHIQSCHSWKTVIFKGPSWACKNTYENTCLYYTTKL